MARSPEALQRQAERAERRSAQILEAARDCIRAEGIRAITMSRVAAKAAMGHGQIYRYFESKEAIMIALCERDFEAFLEHVRKIGLEVAHDAATVAKLFAHEIMWLFNTELAGLTLEVLAEATHNPRLADMSRSIDERVRAVIRNVIAPLLDGVSDSELTMRVETVFVMMRCLVVHIGPRPASDQALLTPGFERAFLAALSPP